jgi:hypothetical protein
MVKSLLNLAVLAGLVALMPPPSAHAMVGGCTTTLAECYEAAAKIDNFWYRWAAGLDCELDYAECVRIKVTGR